MARLFLLLLTVQILGQAIALPQVDPKIPPALTLKGKVNIILTMTSSPQTTQLQATLQNFKDTTIVDRNERLNIVVNLLKTHSTSSQANLLNFLQAPGTKSLYTRVTPLWINNKIIIRGATTQLIEELSSRSDISKIDHESMVQLVNPISKGKGSPRAGEQWGVAIIQAPAVWQTGVNGSNIVVSHIDSGVRGSHEALRNNFREEYGWFDAEEGTTTPNDQLGHGTHTMGTIVGTTNGIGVAPGAQWISCKACTSDCPDIRFLECGQWILCPTNASGHEDCTKAPALVSNSWGVGYNGWYDEVIAAWRAVGIIPLFSAGNNGPSCSTTLYPGDNPDVICVGSTTEKDELSYFSSIGPSPRTNARLPHISAPGSDVYSSSTLGDEEYEYKSGTSMASPHGAGLVALLLSADNTLSFDQIKGALEAGATKTVPWDETCGGISDNVYPNNHAGHGRINAVNSVANVTRNF